ncbi:hypothetical protein LTR37_000147 [Vermiconidia calcicola]|uniref:Uncharacterized protein n=1 Tax=Vermiconidia calcicola TaxID=1690605 RepID=A0ACC3NZJ7_9PEZI|nr:hypothetical protein LTR37_000147 [Vermiconidia calcicola]
MPSRPKDMSWLTPKRRRTTGNLKTANAQVGNGSGTQAVPPVPTLESPIAVERPASTPRTISQPVVPSSSHSNGDSGGDGNLFYAYARKGDDLKSRYLLTFASAYVANEWWLLLQTHFPDASRPGPQLFSFKTDDLLSKVWKHPAFSHLKSKWMYIAFSDTQSEGLGGAAQGIIPVQDAEGNMLGGTAPASPEFVGQMRKEAREVKSEVIKLEEHFEKMMAAITQNTEKVAELSQNRTRSASDVVSSKVESEDGGSTKEASLDMGVLSGHFVRMNDLLSKNSQHMENMVKKHAENEQKLRQTIEGLAAQQKMDYLDMHQLSSHLDRIQTMMAASVNDRKGSAREAPESHTQPLQIDLSPLTDRLEKVQEAVEQNSALVKVLLDEGAGGDSKPGTPFWGKGQSTSPDMSPLTQHLERIHTAIEQQSEHMRALVGFAGGDNEGSKEAASAEHSFSLAPLGEHLEQIYNAIEEGNKHAKETEKIDLGPLAERLEHFYSAARQGNNLERETTPPDFGPLEGHFVALRELSQQHSDHMQQLVEAQNATCQAVEANGQSKVYLGPLDKRLEQLQNAVEEGNRQAQESAKLDLEPLEEHLGALRELSQEQSDRLQHVIERQDATRDAVEANGPSQHYLELLEKHLGGLRELAQHHSGHLQQMVESQHATQKAVEANGPLQPDLEPLEKHLGAVRELLQQHSGHLQQLVDSQNATHKAVEASVPPKMDLGPLERHMEVLGGHSQKHNDYMQQLIESQDGTREAVEANGGEIDFSPLAELLDAIRESSDTNADTIKKLLDSQEATRKESAVDFSPLIEYLEAIRKATTQNVEHTQTLVKSHLSSVMSGRAADLDLTPLTERLNRIHTTLEKQAVPLPGSGDPKFVMSALTSHLSKIQAVTEQNAQHVKALREKQLSSQDKMQVAVSETSEQVQSLVKRNQEQEAWIESQNSQMRELMSGQREMVEVVRSLAKSIVAQNKGACDHVVVPPPRKMGRKVVGFVYDAKEAMS